MGGGDSKNGRRREGSPLRPLPRLNDLLAEDSGYLAQLGDELGELSRCELLRTVGERFGRIGMNLDHDRIAAGGDGGVRQRRDQVANAGRMGNVDADREDRLLVNDGDSGDVEREPRCRLERAQTTLAQNDVVVAVHRQVLGCGKPFGDAARQTALQQHHLMRLRRHLTDVLEQAEVLHVARADLKAIDVGVHHFAVSGIHDFRKGLQAVLLAGVLHDLQALFAKALKGVGVGARLECAAADPGQTQIGNALGDFVELLDGFDRAWAGVERDLVGT